MKKEYTILSAIIAAGIMIGAGSTLAFFTGTSLAANSVRTGNLNIEIRESTQGNDKKDSWVVTQGEAEDDVVLTYTNVVPGDELSKEVFVDNIGTNDAYVRCIINAYFYENGENKGPAELVYFLDGAKVELENNTVYYKDILTAGKDGSAAGTMKVFDQVKVPETWGNAQSGKTIRIEVVAEAVQSENNLNGKQDVKRAFDGVIVTEAKQNKDQKES